MLINIRPFPYYLIPLDSVPVFAFVNIRPAVLFNFLYVGKQRMKKLCYVHREIIGEGGD